MLSCSHNKLFLREQDNILRERDVMLFPQDIILFPQEKIFLACHPWASVASLSMVFSDSDWGKPFQIPYASTSGAWTQLAYFRESWGRNIHLIKHIFASEGHFSFLKTFTPRYARWIAFLEIRNPVLQHVFEDSVNCLM